MSDDSSKFYFSKIPSLEFGFTKCNEVSLIVCIDVVVVVVSHSHFFRSNLCSRKLRKISSICCYHVVARWGRLENVKIMCGWMWKLGRVVAL